MKGIFYPDNYYWDEVGLRYHQLKELDPEKDSQLLLYIALHQKRDRDYVMRKLQITELPEEAYNCDDPGDELYESYIVLREQVAREPDSEVLKEASYEAPGQMKKFAFCYLTGYSYPPSECDAYSYRTYDCGRKKGMTADKIRDFCQEMISVHGPFSEEAGEILENLPMDQNDLTGESMPSTERAPERIPFTRKERRVPFQTPEEYGRERAEIMRIEILGKEALELGSEEEAVRYFCAAHERICNMREFIQTPEVESDYARLCMELGEILEMPYEIAEAIEILERLTVQYPDDEMYGRQLRNAKKLYENVKNIVEKKLFSHRERR